MLPSIDTLKPNVPITHLPLRKMAFGMSTSFDMDAILRGDRPSTDLTPPTLERQRAIGHPATTGLGLAAFPPTSSPFGEPVLPQRMSAGEPPADNPFPFGVPPSTPEPDLNREDCIRVLRTIVETSPAYLIAKFAYLGIADSFDRMGLCQPSSSSSHKFYTYAATLRKLVANNPPIHVHKATLVGIIADLHN